MKALEKAAKALLKRRWYDCEPEAWHDLETFYAQIDPDHVFEAYDEARAVIASIEVDDAMVEAGIGAWDAHANGSFESIVKAIQGAALHSILVDGEGR